MLALNTSLPGPVVSNIAVFVSYKLGGSHWTAAVAVIGAILPTALMMGGRYVPAHDASLGFGNADAG